MNIVIVFPPAAGGNHLKNILNLKNQPSVLNLYKDNAATVHSKIGSNLKAEHFEKADSDIFIGHFAEIMSHKESISKLEDKKFILLLALSDQDFKLLESRRKNISYHQPYGYYHGEQIFLYEPYIYKKCFGLSDADISVIYISEFFTENITPMVDQLNLFLNIDIDKTAVNLMHTKWLKNNHLTLTRT